VNEVFENVIKNGELQVLESEFFGIAIARYSDELPIELSKVILEKYFAKELVSKNKEQAGALKSLCMTLLYHLKNKNVDGNLVNNFEKIIEREGIRTIEFMLDDDTQVTKESAVSKKR